MDLGFTFNNSNFSDRLLRIEIFGNPTEDPPEYEGAGKNKRRRGEQENGDEAPPSSSDEDGSRVLRVETFHASSLLLASKNPFFYKLFSNGMLESKKQCVTLRIDASEEAALMELLKFMYTGTLRVNTASAVLDILIVADKFGVASCISHCCGFLRDMSMTLSRTSDQHHDEVMKLPLVGIEAILSSDDLQVTEEGSNVRLLQQRFCNQSCAVEDLAPTSQVFVEGAYILRPIKVLEFELPRQ